MYHTCVDCVIIRAYSIVVLDDCCMLYLNHHYPLWLTVNVLSVIVIPRQSRYVVTIFLPIIELLEKGIHMNQFEQFAIPQSMIYAEKYVCGYCRVLLCMQFI